MQSAYLTVIDDLKKQIESKEAELLPLKITVNNLCKQAGVQEYYPDLTITAAAGTPNARIARFREDQFFNKGLAPSVVEIMEARDQAGLERPASVDEIYAGLASGGFKFEGTTGSEENSKRALKTALTKNTIYFVKIGEKFALKKWYGMRAPRKPRAGAEIPDAHDDDPQPLEPQQDPISDLPEEQHVP